MDRHAVGCAVTGEILADKAPEIACWLLDLQCRLHVVHRHERPERVGRMRPVRLFVGCLASTRALSRWPGRVCSKTDPVMGS